MYALKQMSAAIGLALAVPALAQAPAPAPAPRGAWPSAEQQRRAAQGAQPAQQAQPAQPAQPTGSPMALTQDQLAALASVWMIDQHHAGLDNLAASRASSAEVKKYAKRIGDDYKRFGTQLQTLLQQRGTNTSALPDPPERQQLENDTKALASRSGQDFDREFITFMKQHGEAWVEAFKRAREATPGKDSELKKLLDDGENAEEFALDQARKFDVGRVQARTPPGR